jgi:hypothetical protein
VDSSQIFHLGSISKYFIFNGVIFNGLIFKRFHLQWRKFLVDSYYIIVNGFILNGFTLYDAATPSTYFNVTANARGLDNDFASGHDCDTSIMISPQQRSGAWLFLHQQFGGITFAIWWFYFG